jgi:hypothetical protein
MAKEEGQMSDQNLQEVKAIYEEVCRSHDGITEFRAKLLGLLPLASGAGIFLLVGNEVVAQDVSVLHLIPIGIFGILISLGLFIYELRGIQKCRGLIRCAQELEKKLLPDNDHWDYGAFNFDQTSLWGFIGATGAALIIYPTVIGAWAYILAVGMVGSLNLDPQNSLFALEVAALAAASAFVLGFEVDRQNRQRLRKKIAKLESKSHEKAVQATNP